MLSCWFLYFKCDVVYIATLSVSRLYSVEWEDTPVRFEPSTSRIQRRINPFAKFSAGIYHNECRLVYALPEIYFSFVMLFISRSLNYPPPLRIPPPQTNYTSIIPFPHPCFRGQLLLIPTFFT